MRRPGYHSYEPEGKPTKSRSVNPSPMPYWPDRQLPVDPTWTTLIVTLLAYGIVVATFADWLPIYPELDRGTIDALSHATAVVNGATVLAILVGWHGIRNGRVRRHAAAMTTALLLIGAFLVLYLTRIGGGGQKEIVGAEGVALAAYLGMLAIHIVLSILAVPLVVYVFLLGATNKVEEIRASRHPTLGRVTAATWLLSLVLGILAYVLLNHVYGAELAA